MVQALVAALKRASGRRSARHRPIYQLTPIQSLCGRMSTAILDEELSAVKAVLSDAKANNLLQKLLDEPVDVHDTALMLAADVRHDRVDSRKRAPILRHLLDSGANMNCIVTVSSRGADDEPVRHQMAFLTYALKFGDRNIREVIFESGKLSHNPKDHGAKNWKKFIEAATKAGVSESVLAELTLRLYDQSPRRSAIVQARATTVRKQTKSRPLPGRRTFISMKHVIKLAEKLRHK